MQECRLRLLPQSDLGLDTNMFIDNELLLNQERLACLCVRAVIAHLLASRFLQGAKVQVFPQLKISVWRAYLTKCADNNVVNCL